MNYLPLMFLALFGGVALAKPMKTIKVGIASNFSKVSSSSSNPYGNYFRDGIKLALEEKKSDLKKSGLKIEIVEFDYGDSQYEVLNAAKKACASDVQIVLGYVYSSHALLAAPLHKKCKLPLLTPSASGDRLGQMGAYVHQGTFDNSFQGEVLAKYAAQTLGAKRSVSISLADCAYCQDLSAAFNRNFKQNGGAVTSFNVLETDDFAKTALKVKQANPDVILIPNHELASARMISALTDAGIKRPFLGGDGWGNVGEQFFNVLNGKKIEGYSLSHWLREVDNPKSKKFVKKYKSKFKKDANDTAVLSYDATHLLLDSIIKSNSVDRQGIEQALSSRRSFEGATGRYAFVAGRAPRKSIILLQNEGDKFRLLKTVHPGALGE